MMNSYKWNTTFDNVSETMIHTYPNKMEVRLNFKFAKVYTLKDTKIVSTIDILDMTLQDYERLLIQVAEADARV